MKFDGSMFENKEELREKILECYGRDIAEASCRFSSRNYAFVISEGAYPVAIRVSVNNGKERIKYRGLQGLLEKKEECLHERNNRTSAFGEAS